MPFPNVNRAPTNSNSCRSESEAERDELLARVAAHAAKFEIDSKVPLRAAVVAYLGLLRLKQANEAGADAIRQTREKCRELMRTLKPETGTKSINCSWFSGDKVSGFLDHTKINSNAMGIYLPGIRSKKKQALVLLALGAEHDESVPVPDSDEWIKGYTFRAP
jgi:hypothetical protein